MPSGIYSDPNLGECKLCKKKLRPLNKNSDFSNRQFHISCLEHQQLYLYIIK